MERLAGFLAERGIDEPVHYVLCEQVIPGVDAQILTAKRKQKWLSRGCRKGAHFLGKEHGDVVAIGLTAAGTAALVDDISTWFSGHRDGTYMPELWKPMIEKWSVAPGYLLGGTRLEFRDREHVFHPVAEERPSPKAGRGILSMRRSDDAAPRAETTTLIGAGDLVLDPPGCHKLEVNVEQWRCLVTEGCFSSRSFVTVRDVGCGDPVNVLIANYSGGVSGPVEVRAVIDTATTGNRVDITSARLSYRLVAPKEE